MKSISVWSKRDLTILMFKHDVLSPEQLSKKLHKPIQEIVAKCQELNYRPLSALRSLEGVSKLLNIPEQTLLQIKKQLHQHWKFMYGQQSKKIWLLTAEQIKTINSYDKSRTC